MPNSPSRLDYLRTLKVANLDGAFANAFISLIGGSVLIKFAKMQFSDPKHADLWIACLVALPSIVGLAQIPGAIWGRGFPHYKPFVARGGLIWRLLYVPLLALPLLHLSPTVTMLALLISISLAAISVNIVTPIYNDWLAEIVPAESRGSFFAGRNALISLAASLAGLSGALIIDGFAVLKKPELGFFLVFVLGLLCAGMSMFYFGQMQDMVRKNPIQTSIRQALPAFLEPLQDRQFRKVLLFLIVFIASQVLPGSLWTQFSLESLNISLTQLQFCAIAHTIGNLIVSKWWGIAADKFGNKPILALATAGIAMTPLAWLACPPNNPSVTLFILLPSHLFMGAIWAAVGLCQFNLLLATAPAEKRASYLGTGLAVQAIVGGVAPLLGAALLTTFRGQVGQAFLAYHYVFVIVIVLRGASLFFLAPIKEEGSAGVRETIKILCGVTPSGLRAMTRFKSAENEIERVRAIQKIGRQGMVLAIDELITALHDPAPKVRRNAAKALGKLNDIKAVGELLHQLEEHPDLVEEETIEALASLGSKESLPNLVELLSSPRPLLRRAACRAIASIPGATDDQESVNAVLYAAAQGDLDLQRAALQAIRNLEILDSTEAVSAAMLSRHPSVRIAAAEAASELELTGTALACRESLTTYDDEASAEMAYTLGVVGKYTDLPRILSAAQSCSSIITRRRCLLGAARLFGVERQAYKMLTLPATERDRAIVATLAARAKDPEHAARLMYAVTAVDLPTTLAELDLPDEAQSFAQIPVEDSILVLINVPSRSEVV